MSSHHVNKKDIGLLYVLCNESHLYHYQEQIDGLRIYGHKTSWVFNEGCDDLYIQMNTHKVIVTLSSAKHNQNYSLAISTLYLKMDKLT